MPNQFLSPEGDLEDYFVNEYWLIDQYIGDHLWTWGAGGAGRLGNGATTGAISTPVTTFAGGTNWKQVSSGNQHTAAIKTDGTLWTWGSGGNGQLGNAVTTGNISTPVTTFAGGTNWKQVSSGYNPTAAIKTDGTLWTWGLASFGTLGNGVTTGNISTPVTTFAGGTNWKQVSVGSNHTAAIKTDGTLWTWGSGTVGRLGNGVTTGNISTPVTTFSGGNNWKQVSSGLGYTAAIKTDGTLWTWGLGDNGRLGNGVTTGNISTPATTFAGGTNWKQVNAGREHTAAIKTDGTLWTWGNGRNGRLGNSVTTGNVSTPVTTFAGGTNWKQVSCGYSHTAAIKTDGTLWTWGANYAMSGDGRLGNAQTTGRSTPVTTFAGGTNWKQVASGVFHTAAVEAGISAEYPLS
jgi:alpha-tubulin suppressor-like RCC1 family protein